VRRGVCGRSDRTPKRWTFSEAGEARSALGASTSIRRTARQRARTAPARQRAAAHCASQTRWANGLELAQQAFSLPLELRHLTCRAASSEMCSRKRTRLGHKRLFSSVRARARTPAEIDRVTAATGVFEAQCAAARCRAAAVSLAAAPPLSSLAAAPPLSSLAAAPPLSSLAAAPPLSSLAAAPRLSSYGSSCTHWLFAREQSIIPRGRGGRFLRRPGASARDAPPLTALMRMHSLHARARSSPDQSARNPPPLLTRC
jgi:hypothetical protein